MEKSEIREFELRTSIYFDKIAELPGEMGEGDEFLLLFELDSAQSGSIEPERELLPGKLVFSGQKTEKLPSDFSLPAGKYLFTQRRTEKKPSGLVQDWLDMAVEQQKDALWERHKLDNRLYVRYLFEDGRYVTQLFRPV